MQVIAFLCQNSELALILACGHWELFLTPHLNSVYECNATE